MGRKDPRIDAYIAKSAEFARPILEHLRKQVHAACPEISETVKWGMPFFEYEGPLCNMAAFKAHMAFGFWKGEIIFGKTAAEQEAMGQFGRIASLKDLPSDKKMNAYVKHAMKLNEAGVKAPSRSKPKDRKPIAAPAYFTAALKKNKKALATFEGFSPGHRREYLEWITEAKTEETRVKRLEQAMAWMAEGKRRNWKYER